MKRGVAGGFDDNASHEPIVPEGVVAIGHVASGADDRAPAARDVFLATMI